MKNNIKYVICFFWLFIISCEDFIDVEFPSTQVNTEDVYNDPSLIDAVLSDVYVQLRDQSLISGGLNGTGVLLGLYTDELQNWNTNNISYHNFYTNNLIPNETLLLTIWSKNYKIIYQCNAIIEGVTKSNVINEEEKKRFIGEAQFVRTLIYFYLTQVFGEIPYTTTTDYNINNSLPKKNQQVLNSILLKDAEETLENLTIGSTSAVENIRASKHAAETLLAKIHLYLGNWSEAIVFSDMVINNSLFNLEEDINKVFLKESKGTILQLKSGLAGQNTHEGQSYNFSTLPPPNRSLTTNFITSFEQGDLRKQFWIKKVGTSNEHFHSYKYKEAQNTATSKEYSIIFRLEELYFIKLEANLFLEKQQLALNTWNFMRNRYGLPLLNEIPVDWKTKLLEDRSHEFFCELGHRFFDLKRFKKLDNILRPIKINWKTYHENWPLPEAELLVNTNLIPQNYGY